MQVNHRKFHSYLGMQLEYNTVGQVNITRFDYIDEIINAFDKANPIGGGTKSSDAPAVIFKVNKDYEILNYKQAV